MPRTIPYKISSNDAFGEVVFTLAQLRAYPITAPLVAAFEEVRARWVTVNAEELGLLEAEATADAHSVRVDEDLDPQVDLLSRTILIATKGDRSDLLFRRYFGRKNPSAVRRPILGIELEDVRGWLPSLAEAEVDALRPIGASFTTLVAEGDAVTKEQSDLRRRWDDFTNLGSWRRFIDELNKLRNDTAADLAKLKNTPEGKDLPANFEARFFIRQSKAPARDSTPTLAGTRARLAELTSELAVQQALLAQLEEAQRLEEAAAAQRHADEDAVAELERQLEELRARLGK